MSVGDENETFFIKVWKPLSTRCEEVESRRGMDTRRCASKDAGLQRGLNGESHINWRRERVQARTQRRWIVRSHVGRSILYKGAETSP